MEPWAAPPECLEQLEKSVREAAEGVIKNALLMLSSIEDKALKITTAIIEGPPRQVILEEAERWGGGSNRHGFNAGWAPGIVSSWAQCRVPWSIMLSVRGNRAATPAGRK